MAFFVLSGITGCITSGETQAQYGQKFNDAMIDTYYKEDYYEFGAGSRKRLVYYGVVCVFGTKSYSFKFRTSTDRDTFYASLP